MNVPYMLIRIFIQPRFDRELRMFPGQIVESNQIRRALKRM